MIKNRFLSFVFSMLLFLFFLGSLNSCYYDVEETLYPATEVCDTSDISFANQVSVTLNTFCLNCHSNTNNASIGGSINLDGYDQMITYVNNGKLLTSIQHGPGASAMPKGGSKLADCDIRKIESWINAGAKNN